MRGHRMRERRRRERRDESVSGGGPSSRSSVFFPDRSSQQSAQPERVNPDHSLDARAKAEWSDPDRLQIMAAVTGDRNPQANHSHRHATTLD